jgi:hypothetical protein
MVSMTWASSRARFAPRQKWEPPVTADPFSPYEGAGDLNAPAATQLDGVLFMEGEGEPVEVAHLKRDLRSFGDDSVAAGEWLEVAMKSSWGVAEVLFEIEGLEDLWDARSTTFWRTA